MSCEQVLAADHPLPRHEPRSFEHVHLRPEPTAAREARSFVRTRAPQLGGDQLAALLTATSELVTNAVLHARSDLVVGITVSPSVVLVTVGDRAPRHPESRSHSDRRESGRGIVLVRALADDWGVVPLPTGTARASGSPCSGTRSTISRPLEQAGRMRRRSMSMDERGAGERPRRGPAAP